MKKTILFTVLFFCISVNAQSEIETNNQYSKSDTFKISVFPAFSELDFGNINNALKNNNLPQVKNDLQFTTYGSISFPLAGINWDITGGISRGSNESNGYSLEQRAMYLEWGFELYSFHKNRHSVFFNIAYGGMSYRIYIHDNGNTGSFFDALEEFGGSVKMESKINRYIALKAGYDWAFDKNENFLLGVRFGYRIGLGKEKFKIKGHQYSDSPESSANGLFFGISLSVR